MKSTIAILVMNLFVVSTAMGAGSSTVTPAKWKDARYYNDGVELMLDKQFAKAEKQFRKAIERNERFAEAHNNLAYTLRKQGASHFDEALSHYNRAIELNPSLTEAFMYRGFLHMQMGNKALALEDHQKLVDMGSPLAAELEFVVVNGKENEPEQFFGVSHKI